MKNGLLGSIVIMAAGLAAVWSASPPVAGQGGQQAPVQQGGTGRGGAGRGGPGRGGAPAAPAGPVNRLPDGKPDMNGYWAGGAGGLARMRPASDEVDGP